LPDLLVDEGARRLALGYLEDAAAARARVKHAADPEALHDYRVAIRHLRSCIRAYRRELRSSVGGRALRHLRCLAQATNRPRDLEVQLAWLSDRRAEADEADRPGIDLLTARVRTAWQRGFSEAYALDAVLFPLIAARLEARLPRFRATIQLGDPTEGRSTAAVTARLVRRAAARLEDRLARVQVYSDLEPLHRARIAAKRLRYLLEPFSMFLPACEPVVQRLKDLQTGLGDVHDAQVFEAELRAALRPGLQTLFAARELGGRQAFERVRSEWLEGAAAPFFHSIVSLTDELVALPHGEREVERKFLLRRLPPVAEAGRVLEIEQGYLPGTRLIERVRRVRSERGVELVRTLKTGGGLARLEIEEPVTPELFGRLWPLTEGRRVHKRRYRMPDGGLTWEIDRFLDRDLVLAEVELGRESREVTFPAWLAPHVDREVTDDEAYSNLHLAVHGVASRTDHVGRVPASRWASLQSATGAAMDDSSSMSDVSKATASV
jgi:CHAD domain-containing protein/CYTH domain-containing protein